MALERCFLFSVMLGIALSFGAPAAFGQEKDKKVPAKEGDKIEAEADGKKSKKVTVKKKGALDLSDLPPAESERRCARDESQILKSITKKDKDFGKELSKKLKETKSLRDRLQYLLRLAPQWDRRADLVEFSYMKDFAGEWEAKRIRSLRGSIRVLAFHCIFVYETVVKQNMLKAGKGEAAYKKFSRELSKRWREYWDYHEKNRADRRKKLDLPEEEGDLPWKLPGGK